MYRNCASVALGHQTEPLKETGYLALKLTVLKMIKLLKIMLVSALRLLSPLNIPRYDYINIIPSETRNFQLCNFGNNQRD